MNLMMNTFTYTHLTMSIDFIRSFTGPHILQQARDIFARKKNPTEFDAHLLFRPGLDSF